MHPVAERVLQGEIRAAARAMRLVDERAEGHVALLKDLSGHLGRAYLIGVTGTPGAGKSTLVDRLITRFRAENQKVGVVAVDPSSPFSGGSILGDRIRMQRHFLDDGVFIRSVATRGALGGLSRSAADVTRILDAFGCDIVLLETVGVGQDELEVTRHAHTTVVVVPPGGGDDIQANKAGILEIADVFVVNKADREGADAQVRHLESMIALGREIRAGHQAARVGPGHGAAAISHTMGHELSATEEEWVPPILKTIAARNEGIDALVTETARHRAWLETPHGRVRRARQQREQLLSMFRDTLVEAALGALGARVDEEAAAVLAGAHDPYTACERLLADFRSASSL